MTKSASEAKQNRDTNRRTVSSHYGRRFGNRFCKAAASYLSSICV